MNGLTMKELRMRMGRRTQRGVVATALMLAAVFAGVCDSAQAQRRQPDSGAPNLAPAVLQTLEAPYLTDEERAELRVFHGVWRPDDLESPARRARAAIIVGAFDDPSLLSPDAAAEDRAEAQLRRGELELSLETLAGEQSFRARRIRASALEGLGRFEEADAAIEPVASDLQRNRVESAADLVEGVRCLIIRARLRGQPAGDYHAMMTLLARARDELNRLYWPAMLVEAQLLYDKDNRKEASEAIAQTLALNPSSADAWALRGRLTVDMFNFAATEEVATRLDRLAARFADDEFATSPLSGAILAQAWLRQNDPDLAEEQIAPVLTRFPKMREALAIRCAVQAVRYDFEGTEKLLAEFDTLSPNSPLALFVVGKALSETRQYAEAADFLERAAERQKNWPPPLIELGLLELQSGRDERAATALRRVATLDPFNVRAANRLRLIRELLTYEKVESEHFVVRFKPGVDRTMAEDMLAPLEEIHKIVAGAIDHTPAVKTIIELMPNHEWFAVRITGMPAIHTIAAATGPVIAMETPRIGPKHTGEYDWVRVVRHEYVHTVTLSRTKNRIPHWFTEAAAVYLEGAPRDYSTAQLLVSALVNDALFDMRKINIAFVRPEKPTDRGQAYAQGHWMYQYMVERFGERAPLRLMDLYADGLREDAAMRSALGISQEEFFQDFKGWARAQAESWGMLPTPTITELQLETALADDAGREMAQKTLSEFAVSAARAMSGLGRVGPFVLDLQAPTPAQVDAWLEKHPEHPDLLEIRIDFAMEQSRGKPTADMIPLLQRYAAARPVDPMPHRHLARLYLVPEAPGAALNAEAARKAIEHLSYLDAREQKTPTFAIEIARQARDLGELDLAGAKAERATQIAPYNASNRELAATIAIQRGDLATAERHIAALVELEPDRGIHAQRLEAIRKMQQQH